MSAIQNTVYTYLEIVREVQLREHDGSLLPIGDWHHGWRKSVGGPHGPHERHSEGDSRSCPQIFWLLHATSTAQASEVSLAVAIAAYCRPECKDSLRAAFHILHLPFLHFCPAPRVQRAKPERDHRRCRPFQVFGSVAPRETLLNDKFFAACPKPHTCTAHAVEPAREREREKIPRIHAPLYCSW